MFLVGFAFRCPTSASIPSSRFGPTDEVKERLHLSALRRPGRPSADVAAGHGDFSRPTLVGDEQDAFVFLYPAAPPRNSAYFDSSDRSKTRFFVGISSLLVSGNKLCLILVGFAFRCPTSASIPSSRFGPPDEVKERLHLSALQRLSGMNKTLSFFYVQLRLLETRHTSIPPTEAQNASLSESPVCSFLNSRLRYSMLVGFLCSHSSCIVLVRLF